MKKPRWRLLWLSGVFGAGAAVASGAGGANGAETAPASTAEKSTAPVYRLLISSVDDGDKRGGITIYAYDSQTAATEKLSAVELSNASFFVPRYDRVYAVEENTGAAARAHSFRFVNDQLAPINSAPTGGDHPCHIAIHPAGKFIIVANYSGGSLSVFPVADDGSIGAAEVIPGAKLSGSTERPAHLHSTIFSRDGKFMFAADLGQDLIYEFGVNLGAQTGGFLFMAPPSISLPRGAGPRHLTFAPDSNVLYCISEFAGTVTAFSRPAQSTYNVASPPYRWSAFQTVKSDSSEAARAKSGADIHFSPDGKFLYTSNRITSDSVTIFREDKGELTRVGEQPTGKHPRNFAISPDGRFVLVACRDDNLVQIFSRDPETGMLTHANADIMVQRPTCVQFAAAR
jgi:6-phosphogluconolactonase (cycloisomerase 2 family)